MDAFISKPITPGKIADALRRTSGARCERPPRSRSARRPPRSSSRRGRSTWRCCSFLGNETLEGLATQIDRFLASFETDRVNARNDHRDRRSRRDSPHRPPAAFPLQRREIRAASASLPLEIQKRSADATSTGSDSGTLCRVRTRVRRRSGINWNRSVLRLDLGEPVLDRRRRSAWGCPSGRACAGCCCGGSGRCAAKG